MINRYKIISMIKKHYSTLIIATLAIVLLFVPQAKAYVQQGLMKVGLFQPKIEKVEEINSDPVKPSTNYKFEMIDAKGKITKLEDLKGKVVFINFWATWCGPCIAEMPTIQKLYDKVKDDKDVVLLTVEVENKKENAVSFMKKRNLNLPLVFPNSAIPQEFLDRSIPTTVILDKQGNIAHTTVGMADYSGQEVIDFFNELKKMN